MKRMNEEYTVELTPEGIDTVSDKIREFLSSSDLSRADVNRYALSAEEILLDNLERQNGVVPVRLTLTSGFFSSFVKLEIEGVAFNVYASSKEERGALCDGLLTNLGIEPEYKYGGNRNVYRFRFGKKRMNPFLKLVIVLAAAFAAGFAGLLLPGDARAFVLEEILDRLHGTFLNILSCLAGPMIFLSVAWGVYGIGDAATLKRIGKRLMLRYMVLVCVCLLIGAAICFPIFRPSLSDAEGTGDLGILFSMILEIIPSDIVSPFVNGNTLQIIFMAMIVGIALLFLGQKTQSVARAIEQINYLIQFIIEVISKLVPCFIFIAIVSMIWSDAASVFLKLRSLFLVFLLTVAVTQIWLIGFTAIRSRVNPILLIKKGLPTLVIALTTASSAAAFGFNIKACRDEYGIDETVSSFGIPLGMVLFKPNTALSYLVMSVFFAKTCGVEISGTWILILLFSAAVLAMATPPIPGGALTAYTIMFTQLGIPAEAIAIALACDTLFDFVTTGFDQFSIPFGLLGQATGLGLVDRDVLGKRKNKVS